MEHVFEIAEEEEIAGLLDGDGDGERRGGEGHDGVDMTAEDTAEKAGGFGAAELKKGGFSAAELKAGGFSAAELKAVGFGAAELKAGGFSAAELVATGGDLRAWGLPIAEAKAGGLKGIMIVVQADMGFDVPETEKDDESRLPDRDGYALFLDAMTAATKAFAGQVLLVHGDSHFFTLDKPLVNATHMLANFTRLQTFGSPNVHWVRVTVDATTRNVFMVEPMIVPGNALKSLNAE